MSGEERNRLLIEFNRVNPEYPADRTVHGLFERRAAGNPHAAALVHDHQTLTYAGLNEGANRMAARLREKGITRGAIVGIMMKRSIEMIVGILGILKTGAAYLPIDPGLPGKRIVSMLNEARVPALLTEDRLVSDHSFTALLADRPAFREPHVTGVRPPIRDLDNLPIPNRSLVDYEKYNLHIGQAMVKNSISLQATRGCPYKCMYCHNIWPKTHVVRTAEHIFDEVSLYYNIGVRRFAFIDDIFNLHRENSRRFFEMVIENGLDIKLFFPNGLRGDLLTKEYIDLMVKAGTVNIAFALETASPRLQKLIRKNLNLKRFHENIRYLCESYPHVVLELFTMHGFPTETEEEAMKTLEFIESLKWVHFPYVFVLKIFPNTDMEKLALENGVSREAILNSMDGTYHDLPETLPFEKSFSLFYQSRFFNEYFLSKERLLHVLPYQMKHFTESEIVQNYNSYLPVAITSLSDLLQFAGILPGELETQRCVDEDFYHVPRLHERMKTHFPPRRPDKDALRVLLMDLSQLFTLEGGDFVDLLEPPLGLMYIMTYLEREFGNKVHGKIVKSRTDFDSFDQLRALLEEFKPDVIGIRTLSYFKDFFHRSVTVIRQSRFDGPVIAGGPYATSGYSSLLQDCSIDLVVMGEGEVTFCEIIRRIMDNNRRFPDEDELKTIDGIAFLPG